MHPAIHAMAHTAQKEKAKGNESRGNGILMAVLGFMLMPIPIVGLPLLIAGIVKAMGAKDGE